MGPAAVRFEVVDPLDERAVASLTAYFEELDERFPTGFQPGDALIADAPSFRPPEGAFVIAIVDGRTIGCGGVLTLGPGVGEIKRMWIAPQSRRFGIGRQMLSELEDQARRLGHHTVRLDTNSVLTEAITMYESAGYLPIDRYNDNPFARRWFEKSLEGSPPE